ncbi:hypothetical protein ACTP2L_10275, partial [Campylobacter jejuni]
SIEVAGNTVGSSSSVTVDNAGRIASTNDAAIGGGQYNPQAFITNRTGATIAGNGTAIRVSGGTLINAGTIIG